MQVGEFSFFFTKTLRICYYFPRPAVVCGFQTYRLINALYICVFNVM